jgi:hypothetical protein
VADTAAVQCTDHSTEGFMLLKQTVTVLQEFYETHKGTVDIMNHHLSVPLMKCTSWAVLNVPSIKIKYNGRTTLWCIKSHVSPQKMDHPLGQTMHLTEMAENKLSTIP